MRRHGWTGSVDFAYKLREFKNSTNECSIFLDRPEVQIRTPAKIFGIYCLLNIVPCSGLKLISLYEKIYFEKDPTHMSGVLLNSE